MRPVFETLINSALVLGTVQTTAEQHSKLTTFRFRVTARLDLTSVAKLTNSYAKLTNSYLTHILRILKYIR